jgi:hypothetical protein
VLSNEDVAHAIRCKRNMQKRRDTRRTRFVLLCDKGVVTTDDSLTQRSWIFMSRTSVHQRGCISIWRIKIQSWVDCWARGESDPKEKKKKKMTSDGSRLSANNGSSASSSNVSELAGVQLGRSMPFALSPAIFIGDFVSTPPPSEVVHSRTSIYVLNWSKMVVLIAKST